MKTKIIPFNLETAKKIQAGKIKGRVLDRDNFEGTIITTNGVNTPLPVVIKFSFAEGDNILFFGIDGKNAKGNKLVFEVPDNEPQEPQFKPFDRVLVRNDINSIWQPSIFSYQLGDCYYTVSSYPYKEENIIPYAGNEHLVGTTNKPNEN